MIRSVFAAAVLFSVVLTSGALADGQAHVVDYNGDTLAEVIDLRPDQVARIRLTENTSTGHLWVMTHPVHPRLKIYGEQHVNLHPGQFGRPGLREIYVSGALAGDAELQLEYRRLYETSAKKTKTIRFSSQGAFTGFFSIAPQQPAHLSKEATQSDPDSQLPDRFNYCDEENGGCPAIKDQGSCGSCWAFAGIGTLETLVLVKDGVEVDLSEQYLVSCDSSANGCNGGWCPLDGLTSVDDDGGGPGAPLEEDFPYTATDSPCDGPWEKAYKGDEWGYVAGGLGVAPAEEIKQALYDHGPVWVGICAGIETQIYTGGIIEEGLCPLVNHAVVLTGWNEEEGGGGYWYMRNSWGPSWGEDGYARIRYGALQVGSNAAWISYEGHPDEEDPEVQITKPKDGAVFVEGDAVSVEAAATDDKEVEEVELFLNNESQGEGTPVDTAAEDEYGWEISDLDPGDYILRAVAVDTSGNTGQSKDIAFTVEPSDDDDNDDNDNDDDSSGDNDDDNADEGDDDDSDGSEGESDCGCQTAGRSSSNLLFDLLIRALQ